MSIIGIVIVIYFCISQFKAERPKRFRYLLLPLYALVMFLNTFKMSSANLWLAIGIILVGCLIGLSQGYFARVIPTVGFNGQSQVTVKGGWPFLIGWLLILVVQIGLSFLLEHQQISPQIISQELLHSVLEELLPFRRVNAFNWWALWALSGSASLAYTGMLAYRSPAFRQTIQKGAHRQDCHAHRQ